MLKLGAVFSKMSNWAVHVVSDGLLTTGQDPSSSGPAAKGPHGEAQQNEEVNEQRLRGGFCLPFDFPGRSAHRPLGRFSRNGAVPVSAPPVDINIDHACLFKAVRNALLAQLGAGQLSSRCSSADVRMISARVVALPARGKRLRLTQVVILLRRRDRGARADQSLLALSSVSAFLAAASGFMFEPSYYRECA